jgi:tRNA(Arg) A34 adenosine deaminase TadA
MDGEAIDEGVNRVTEVNDPTAHEEAIATRGASSAAFVYSNLAADHLL